MSSTDIEKKSLEAHVELCAERYRNLEEKFNGVETRMDRLESYLVEIKNSLANSDSGQYKTLITIGTTILGVLVAGVITLISTHFK
jgi:chromosome segregation ATPase